MKRLDREFRCDEGRTHSLEMLIETIRAISPDYPEFDLGDLTAFAVRSRYPLVRDMHTVQSHNNVPIRLSPERWGHISQNHPELAGVELVAQKEQNMAMSIAFPVQEVLRLFQENRTEALWMDYDTEADVLYINFRRPAPADHSELDENEIILRYHGEELIGFTILNASQR